MKLLLVALLCAISYAQTAPSDVDIEIFNLMNQLRADGFTCPDGTTFAPNPTPQEFDCRLWKAAYLHSEDMGTNSYFSHTSQDGRSPWDRAEEQGIDASGENIAAGNSAAQNTLNQWINSNGHCKNIGNTAFTLNAVARAVVSGSPFTNYWTQMMARSSQMPADTSCLSSGSSTTSAAVDTTTSGAVTTTTTASRTTTTTDSGSPACVGDHSSWRSNWGRCPSYKTGRSNHNWCNADIGRDGNLAQNVCPQCEVCTASAETKVGVARVIGEAITKDDLQAENQKLRKANTALRQALRTLQNN